MIWVPVICIAVFGIVEIILLIDILENISDGQRDK